MPTISTLLPLPSPYGSDRNGLVCGYLFTAGSAGQPVTLDAALAWLATPPVPGQAGFVWLHFKLADAAAESWMRSHLALAPEFFEALHKSSRSTRIEDASDHLIAVVNDVADEFSLEPSEIASLWGRFRPTRGPPPMQVACRTTERLDQECSGVSPIAFSSTPSAGGAAHLGQEEPS